MLSFFLENLSRYVELHANFSRNWVTAEEKTKILKALQIAEYPEETIIDA